MPHNRLQVIAPALLLLSLTACAAPPTVSNDQPAMSTPIAGFVTDMAAFDSFIATTPTPEQFKARYPDVTLVLPGSIATKELRMNNSRYFAQVDAEGRITGGKFQ